ncbi:twin-arginine translocase TatA/TatE family subunit [Microbacterium sp. Marseille-Q6965]|uniref:twin-arginine translocase TatA/TatE family subunit n=1 Tax=Microbacterium sp. Marseille-Q6965 TaxID=2965072 RepID=UPI0021B74519|nr:twin-arginine translocase TatA/TatE family subunit [Microbacterium sp. Marseille-Q6965]
MHMPGIWQILLILAIILLIFGAARLPALAKSLGQSARVFRGEIKQMKEESGPGGTAPSKAADQPGTATPPAAPAADGTDPKP